MRTRLLHEEIREQDGSTGGGVRVLFFWLVFAVLIAGIAWFGWLFLQIRQAASIDQADAADAIAVFGAAEYHGRPSPVLNARLEHALDLYRRRLAPIIIALGGGSDPQYSEGGVGRDFLLAHGVPDDRIIAETTSSDTEESVRRLAAIARENHLQTILIVSDGTHLFRVQKLCAAQGLHVLLSPRIAGKSVDRADIAGRYAHEMIAYTLWRLHLH
ncbi:MAG TPA: YdcF family protein [Acidobacteriaceae bacterium]|nr:YdcF family protein [Acidobacteriaceae bacterium]